MLATRRLTSILETRGGVEAWAGVKPETKRDVLLRKQYHLAGIYQFSDRKTRAFRALVVFDQRERFA